MLCLTRIYLNMYNKIIGATHHELPRFRLYSLCRNVNMAKLHFNPVLFQDLHIFNNENVGEINIKY